MKILIAEDDITSRGMLRALLFKQGHDVIETRDGAAAWSVMSGPDAPRLAILDWVMPEMDGVDLCRRIRAEKIEPPPYLLLLTVRGETADIVEGLSAGADDYLIKPFNPEELRVRVDVGRRMTEVQDQMLEIRDRLARKVGELTDALAHIRRLQGILPICANCKKVRDDKGYWQQVEVYIRDRTDAEFSHCICPECMWKLYPEYAKAVGDEI